jgi:DNA-directed RNA polymerase specialized sigma24 family protein
LSTESSFRRATQAILTAWGTWSRVNSGEVRGYPHQTPERRLYSLPGQTARPISLSDDAGWRVDRAVSKLGERFPDEHAALTLWYIDRLPISEIARRLNAGDTKAREVLRCGENAVELLLDPDILY